MSGIRAGDDDAGDGVGHDESEEEELSSEVEPSSEEELSSEAELSSGMMMGSRASVPQD